MRGSTVLFVLAFGCGKSEASPAVANDQRTTCNSDSDCEMAPSKSCCTCCPETRRAMPKREIEAQRQRCAVVECSACKEGIQCEAPQDTSGVVAVCKAGTCVSAAKK